MFASLGCRAQSTPAGTPLSPELARRVEVLIRSRTSVPPDYALHIGPREKSELPGFDAIQVTFSTAAGQTSKPATFLLSTDGNTLAQLSRFDISKDPKELVSGAGRPARGGPATAPVLIVGFDDLECPLCAKMHAELFPALLARYGDRVHIVYRDFPLDYHPWAMRAAIDANCLGAESTAGYWAFVDHVHAHAAELGGEEKSVAKASETLDALARDEGARQKIDAKALAVCLAKQDGTAVKASLKSGEELGVGATPTLFINGEKLEGAYPIEDVYRMIDGALVAAGQTPPPPPVVPAPPPPASASTKGASTKPGS